MISQKTIKLYVYVDGINDVPFYGDVSSAYEEFILANGELFQTANGFIFNVRHTNEQIEIGSFRYDAKRMGGAPTISFTLMYEDCLDNFWGENVYAVFNGEKYFLKQTPTSSLSNEDARYKHEVELISERVALDNVYFFDAVVGVPQESDKPVSNSSKVVFFGDIHEFAHRMNASLEYTKLLKWEDGVDDEGNAIKIANGYNIVVDEGITSEEKLMSFEDQFFSNVLQEIYNTYEVPYYFVGKTIHIGFANDAVVPPTFAYGVDDALLSITKNNANYKIVNRATATGSSDNIPFYYPNNSPKGVIAAVSSNPNVEAKVLDYELYADKVKLDGVVRKSNIEYANIKVTHTAEEEIVSGQTFSAQMGGGGKGTSFYISFDAEEAGIFLLNFSSEVFRFLQNGVEKDDATIGVSYGITLLDETDSNKIVGDTLYKDYNVKEIDNYEVPIPFAGHKYKIRVEVSYSAQGKYSGKAGQIVYDASYSFGGTSGWMYEDKVVELKDLGLFVEGDSQSGDTITQELVEYINTSQNLMPYKYRETKGKERFYNATNGTYEGVAFNNPFIEGKPKEHIIEVEEIKPTIKEAVNAMGLRMDMFSEFAYDLNDNDETIENDEGSQRDYVHSYFFGKLRKLDFNLFEHAIENQPMTISFTSGDCGACNFEIGVTEEFPQKNPVLVNADGTLKRDEDGNVICGQFQEVTEDEIQDIQQDTINNEVWIALKKEDTTYGILMPKAEIYEKDENGNIVYDENGKAVVKEAGHRPKPCTEGQNDGDTFVILGINLPESYIINAEKKLEAEIIKYLQENNDEKFTFGITFSRIFFEENPDVLDYLNENSRINVTYNGKTYLLYVTSFSYSMGEGDVLPEIRVELDESLVVSQNALQKAINQVKSEVGRALSNIDALALAQPYFIRKDTDDEANGKINFTKGIKFGEGGKVEVLDNNSAKLTIEYLEVTKKASFTSLEVKEKTHVGGQIIISPAAMTCGEVEELENAYRCYFQTKGADGNDEIFNQFAINDLAICQTYNAWGSRYYWRKVVGVGEDYIDLSKTICDEGSGIPMAGDKIVQLGNTEDAARQAAQVLSAYGDDAPSFIMYNGINDFTLEGKNITGVIWNPETQEPQMYSYGSFFFGDRQLDGNYITFQQKDGESKKTLSINADINIGANSTGLTNLAEWKEKQEQIDAATQGVTLVQQDVQNLQDQIDGVVENHFYEGVPTNDNFPAIQWTTDEEKANHLGDTYVNIASEEQDPDNAGKAWRWAYTDSEHTGYHWHPIADTDAVKALLEAYKAQAGIDDLQYLKGTFEKSVDVDGVVMSEMVAVRDGGGYIEAFLNGSDNEDFIDNEHGKLILASGIPVDGENLKERAKEAKTKMYEDGRFETTEGKMELMRVNSMRGMVSQIDAAIHFNQTPWYITEFRAYNGLSNSPDDIILGGYKTEPTEKTMSTGWPLDWNTEPDLTWDYTQIGRRRTFIHHKATSGYESNWCSLYAPDYEERPNDTSGLYPPYFYVDGTPRKYLDIYPNDCIQLYGYGYPTKEDRSEGVFMGWIVTNRTPIFGGVNKYHLSGMQEGLRPKVRTIASSETLSELDHTVIINNSSAITITLPSNPQEGQTYKILHTSAVGVTIDWNGSGAMNVSTGNTPNATFSARRSVVLTYCSGTWYAEYLELSN